MEIYSENEIEEAEPKKRKRKKEGILDEGIDPTLAAQMMQQFFQMEEVRLIFKIKLPNF